MHFLYLNCHQSIDDEFATSECMGATMYGAQLGNQKQILAGERTWKSTTSLAMFKVHQCLKAFEEMLKCRSFKMHCFFVFFQKIIIIPRSQHPIKVCHLHMTLRIWIVTIA